MELNDESRAGCPQGNGHHEVRVEDGARPPLNHGDVRPRSTYECTGPYEAGGRVPVHAVVHEDPWRIFELRQTTADSARARVEASGQESSHQYDRRGVALRQFESQPMGVVADPT